MAKSTTNFGGEFGIDVQLLPEFKIRPKINAEVSRTGKGASAGEGGYYLPKTKPPSPGQKPTSGAGPGDIFFRNANKAIARDDDEPGDDDDDNAKGGLIKKVKGGKPKGSKDHGKITAQRGEYVIQKSAVKKHGVPALDALNSGRASVAISKSANKAKPTVRKR